MKAEEVKKTKNFHQVTIINTILKDLVKMQQSCAPIRVSIGTVNESNQVEKNVLVIEKACPAVVSYLVSNENVYVHVDPKGMVVTPKL